MGVGSGGESAAKAALREAVRRRVASMSEAERACASAAVCARLAGLVRGPVLVYAPLRDEPDITAWARGLIGRGEVVCVPRVDWEGGRMEAARVSDWDADLERGGRGTRQPASRCEAVGVEDLSAVVVPGVAFDLGGGRLGRSGGYYDRFLARVPARVVRVGVAFDAAIVDRVPMEAWDMPVDVVVTESRTARCRG